VTFAEGMETKSDEMNKIEYLKPQVLATGSFLRSNSVPVAASSPLASALSDMHGKHRCSISTCHTVHV
jgi:hypothetical protein